MRVGCLKVLVIGAGSVAQLHLHSLLGMSEVSCCVFDIDVKKAKHLANASKIGFLESLTESSLSKFDAVFICSPTGLHLEHAKLAASQGCHLFIEKPLASELQGVEELIEIINSNNLITLVGCNLIFDPVIKKINELLKSGSLGRIFSAKAYFSHSLAQMRPGVELKDVYAFYRAQGGGVLLDCGSHELQYLSYMFGNVASFKGYVEKTGVYSSDIEDQALLLCKFTSGVIATVSLDFLNPCRSRGVEIVCEKGTVVWSQRGKPIRNELKLYQGNGQEQVIDLSNICNDGSSSFVGEAHHFINSVLQRKQTVQPVAKAAEILSLLLKMRDLEHAK